MKSEACKGDSIGIAENDAVYREMYMEMRRFRDYEFNASVWYDSRLVALLGFVVTARYGAIGRLPDVIEKPAVANAVFILGALIAITSAAIVIHCRCRYTKLRQWTNSMEPLWKKRMKLRSLPAVFPCVGILLTPAAILVLLWVATFHEHLTK